MSEAANEETKTQQDAPDDAPPFVRRVVRTYDSLGRLRSEWIPSTDAYLRVSYVSDGR